MFIDKANVELQAGDGGNGMISFRRENMFLLVAQMVVMVVAEVQFIFVQLLMFQH